jgi:hypothetical protein
MACVLVSRIIEVFAMQQCDIRCGVADNGDVLCGRAKEPRQVNQRARLSFRSDAMVRRHCEVILTKQKTGSSNQFTAIRISRRHKADSR